MTRYMIEFETDEELDIQSFMEDVLKDNGVEYLLLVTDEEEVEEEEEDE